MVARCGSFDKIDMGYGFGVCVCVMGAQQGPPHFLTALFGFLHIDFIGEPRNA